MFHGTLLGPPLQFEHGRAVVVDAKRRFVVAAMAERDREAVPLGFAAQRPPVYMVLFKVTRSAADMATPFASFENTFHFFTCFLFEALTSNLPV